MHSNSGKGQELKKSSGRTRGTARSKVRGSLVRDRTGSGVSRCRIEGKVSHQGPGASPEVAEAGFPPKGAGLPP